MPFPPGQTLCGHSIIPENGSEGWLGSTDDVVQSRVLRRRGYQGIKVAESSGPAPHPPLQRAIGLANRAGALTRLLSKSGGRRGMPRPGLPVWVSKPVQPAYICLPSTKFWSTRMGSAPMISCLRGRRVNWLHYRVMNLASAVGLSPTRPSVRGGCSICFAFADTRIGCR